MTRGIKNILKAIGVYYPLLSYYHSRKFAARNRQYKKEYQQYAGSGYLCNVCGSSYSRFVPDLPSSENKNALDKNQVIAGYGEHILCPNCMSTARERLIIAYLKDKVNLEGKKVLHLSPERKVSIYLREKAAVTTADLMPEIYMSIVKDVQRQDATKFTFTDNSFDILVANHILEHIPDDRKAMREMYRVLKPGGLAILQVPYSETIATTIEEPAINDPAKQSALFGQEDHVRIFELNDYMHRLKSVGFIVELLPQADIDHYAIHATQPGEKLFVIHKP